MEHKETGLEPGLSGSSGELASRREPPDVEPAVARCRDALDLAAKLGERPTHRRTAVSVSAVSMRSVWKAAAAGEHLRVAATAFNGVRD